MARFLPFALFLTLAPSAVAQVAPLVPRDDGASDPSFVVFRARLLTALAARDTAAVLGTFAPDARLSFGDTPPGPAGVREMWLEGRYEGYDLWTTLARVAATGSVRESDSLITAPYTYAGMPDGFDAFAHGVVVGERVNVRAAPSPGAASLAQLSYSVVSLVLWATEETPQAARWHRVRLADGQEGYVAADYLWSPVDYRAGFARRADRWQIVFFLAGD